MQSQDKKNLIDVCDICISDKCPQKGTGGFLPYCPKDTISFPLDEVGLVPPLCPVCEAPVDSEIANGHLVARASARIAKLHPACLKCDGLFETCEGTTVGEWESRWSDPGQAEDPFCFTLAFCWPCRL
jgi:hypothetical protein